MDPAPRAVDAKADPRNEHEQQQQEADQQERHRVALDPGKLDARDHDARRDAEAEEHEMTREVIERPDMLAVGDRDRARCDHDDADARERSRGEDEAQVVASFRLAAPLRLGFS